MKIYGAIGDYKWLRKRGEIVFVAERQTTKERFKNDLKKNEFIADMIITEKTMARIRVCSDDELWKIVQKNTPNYRKWLNVYQYIRQCRDIIEEQWNKEEEGE